MQIFLIRHGETVDNIAGLYAGVRDSQLTNYGVEQTTRLGAYFATNGTRFTHIFASPLTRAFQTAEAIQRSQATATVDQSTLEIVKVAGLIEQDFGFYEGKSFQARSSPRKTGRESHAELHRGEPGFQDVESKDAMAKRADAFLDEHLMRLVHEDSSQPVVAIVSHGMLLSTLWRRMLRRMSPGSLTIASEVTASRGPVVLEHLGGWSNTGYLHLSFSPRSMADADDATKATPVPANTGPQPLAFRHLNVTIAAIDSRAHLVGLKRQRGGIGRLAHDTSQRKLDSFFKKPKTG